MMAAETDNSESEKAMTTQTRGWSAEELRRAMWLAHGGVSPSRPATSRVAAAAGLSTRTVQRWLAGEATPTADHAAALRSVLYPDAKTVAAERMERRHAEAAAKELSRARPRPASSQWRQMRWHEPHILWLLHHEDLGVNRTMITRSTTTKPVEIPAGWTLIDRATFPNRPLAVMTKHSLLEEMSPWRVQLREGLVDAGVSESWLGTAPRPSLSR